MASHSASNSKKEQEPQPQPNPVGKIIALKFLSEFRAKNPDLVVPDFPNMGYNELLDWIVKNKPKQ